MLHLEYEIFSQLQQKSQQQKGHNIYKGFAFPKIYDYKQTDYYCFMAMELLDTTLQDFANKQMLNSFSKDCLIRIFYNLLSIVQQTHKIGYLHRDLKPANFMLKKNKVESNEVQKKYQTKLYPIDLGLSKKYLSTLTNKHISYRQNKKMVGTALFCSLNTHKGIQQSRRDDIESLVYMVTYLVKKLPWQSAANKADQKKRFSPLKNQINSQVPSPTKLKHIKNKLQAYEEIYSIKRNTNMVQFLRDPNILPECFLTIYKHAIELNFQDQPNYQHLYNVLQKEHYQLTKKLLSKDSCSCIWTKAKNIDSQQKNNFTNKNQTQKQNEQTQKKKIKINFKIPANKLKKSISPLLKNEPQNISQKK